MRIDVEKFGFNYFLSDKVKVNDLEVSARKFGGATKIVEKDYTYSNIAKDNYITLTNDNRISVFIPSTINIDNKIDNSKTVLSVGNKIFQKYKKISEVYNAVGSWFSDTLNKVVIEEITLLTIRLDKVTSKDIEFFQKLANYIKIELMQENVSISINDSLAII